MSVSVSTQWLTPLPEALLKETDIFQFIRQFFVCFETRTFIPAVLGRVTESYPYGAESRL